MTVKWTPEVEQRFTELRLRKLSGSLTEPEEHELAKLRLLVTAVESEIAENGLQRLESEQIALQKILDMQQAENRELMQLFNQQALLIADTKRWLKEFEKRYTSIQNSFAHLAN